MSNQVATIVTNKILEKIEAGTLPWRKPWANGWQASYISKRPYTGFNQILLQMEAQEQNFSSNLWLTFNQASKLGKVSKGSKSTPIIFWGMGEDDTATDKDGKPKTYRFMRYYRVFNACQVEGLKLEESKFQLKPKAESVAKDYLTREKIELRHGGNRACYSPSLDNITLPPQAQFKDSAGYYSTLFHEITHSTGHKSRLDRELSTSFGTDDYSKEELIAELGACMVCHHTGITPELDNSASYIKGWSKALKDNRNLIISASSKAQKAFEYITK